MADYPHYSNYATLSEAIIDFGNLARGHGLNVGVQETLDILQAAQSGALEGMQTFRYSLRSIYCCAEEDLAVFDKLFDWFWKAEKGALKSRTTFKNRSNLQKRSNGSLVMLGRGRQKEDAEETQNVSGANEAAALRKTDFSKLSEIDSRWLEEIAMKLWKQMSLRLKRKLKAAPNGGKVDLRKTIRKSIGQGGEPIELMYKRQKPRRQRLIILLDVSGSMDKYSFFLLRFLVALKMHFEKIEAFIFSTCLLRITEYLHAKNLDLTLAKLSEKADNWSSGTRIGACLKSFNELYAKRILNGHSTVIILSDGLDTGEPAELNAELKKIKLRTRRLIWLNPLKGMEGYEPVQRGIAAALPEVDVFRSAHNLDSILELEKFLTHV